MKIEVTTSTESSPPVQVNIEDWCKLTDAMQMSPESTIADIIAKVESIRETAYKTHREQVHYKQALGEIESIAYVADVSRQRAKAITQILEVARKALGVPV